MPPVQKILPLSYLLTLCLALCCLSACKKKVKAEVLVYDNDFATVDFRGITGANISNIKGSNMLGPFNKGKFTLSLKDLPRHNYLEVSFDLYIMDSWDGNKGGVDGPDFWEIFIDGNLYLKTTFLYRICAGDGCDSQSFPGSYPASNYPRTGADPKLMRGACILYPESDGTILYHIKRLIPHRSSSLKMDIADELKQLDVPPDDQQFCDESWGLDNLVVKTVIIN